MYRLATLGLTLGMHIASRPASSVKNTHTPTTCRCTGNLLADDPGKCDVTQVGMHGSLGTGMYL